MSESKDALIAEAREMSSFVERTSHYAGLSDLLTRLADALATLQPARAAGEWEDERREQLKTAFVAGCVEMLQWLHSAMPQDDLDEAGYDYAEPVIRTLAAAPPPPAEEPTMTEDQIKHMVDRFLQWRLPDPWHPDGGIHFDADAATKLNPRNARYEPVGTNLFDATQATAMVRHMVEGLTPPAEAQAE